MSDVGARTLEISMTKCFVGNYFFFLLLVVSRPLLFQFLRKLSMNIRRKEKDVSKPRDLELPDKLTCLMTWYANESSGWVDMLTVLFWHVSSSNLLALFLYLPTTSVGWFLYSSLIYMNCFSLDAWEIH